MTDDTTLPTIQPGRQVSPIERLAQIPEKGTSRKVRSSNGTDAHLGENPNWSVLCRSQRARNEFEIGFDPAEWS